MFGRLRQTLAPAIALAFYALATLGLGFAHKPISTPDAADSAAYWIAGAGASSICFHSDNGGPVEQQAHLDHCDACALSAAPGLPLPPKTCLPAPDARLVKRDPTPVEQVAMTLVEAPKSRGPPQA